MRGVVMYGPGDVQVEDRDDPKFIEPTDAIIRVSATCVCGSDAIPGDELFMAGVHSHGGPAPVREYLPDLIQLIWDRKIDPGKVFDLTLPLDRAVEGYQATDGRTATKVLLTV